MKIAICIGHSRSIYGRLDGGAVSVNGVSEWEYNSKLASLLADELEVNGLQPIIISSYQGSSYGSAMQWLANHLKSEGVEFAVELHFNAATPSARGHEWLYWHSSSASKKVAEALSDAMTQVVPDLPVRGTKARAGGNRGAEFLRLTHCPAIIAEPFFGSNPQDWEIATKSKTEIARAMAEGISNGLGTQESTPAPPTQPDTPDHGPSIRYRLGLIREQIAEIERMLP